MKIIAETFVILLQILGLGVMVFNATFNNILVLLVEETRVPGENH
jgi:hypothetical protein